MSQFVVDLSESLEGDFRKLVQVLPDNTSLMETHYYILFVTSLGNLKFVLILPHYTSLTKGHYYIFSIKFLRLREIGTFLILEKETYGFV
ncbi:unnamed protein product [Acanthoscelides obtectus]|uniref:Uncharacterized protein n=1 Tax=Acanthoscelides obtectus TaxID=200917 RepID=A0A9P0P297_ACAOB|nr:unnamed protein product [Acanthoscelides obtectus]CAK1632663.1 hypothetical protein AOBTE_LOCUS7665 [Acanthoscelides obtectus]